MTLLSCGIPPRGGEANAAYYASVLAKLPCVSWLDWRFQQVGTPGYTPCLFDGNVERLAQFTAIVSAAAELPEMVLLWNEPCRKKQANMTPEEAVTALRQFWAQWGDWALPAYIGGVNVSVHDDAPAYAWLGAFVGLLSNVERKAVYGWHIHAYGDAEAFAEAVERFEMWMRHVCMVRPVIVSEFASTVEPAALMAVAEDMIRSGRLRMAFWFSAYWADWPEPSLLTADGELTAIGEAWMKEREVVHMPVVYAT